MSEQPLYNIQGTELRGLRGCPFCGGCELSIFNTGGHWSVVCKCNASVKLHESEMEAVTAWNGRAGNEIYELLTLIRKSYDQINCERIPDPLYEEIESTLSMWGRL